MKLTRLSGPKMGKLLTKLGFRNVHQVGAHAKFVHSDGRITMVPMHGNEEIGTGLTLEIIKQAGLKREDYERFVKELL